MILFDRVHPYELVQSLPYRGTRIALYAAPTASSAEWLECILNDMDLTWRRMDGYPSVYEVRGGTVYNYHRVDMAISLRRAFGAH